MRPNAYYELTDGCELTLADIRCQYFFGPPPSWEDQGTGTEDRKEEEGSCEQTQAYDFEEEGGGSGWQGEVVEAKAAASLAGNHTGMCLNT